MERMGPSPGRRSGRSFPLFRRDSASSRQFEKRSFDPDNIVPHKPSRPIYGMERSQSENEALPPIDSQPSGPEGALENGASAEETQSPESNAMNDEEPYDLRPPPPTARQDNIESLALRCFSADHLNLIIREPAHCARFKKFLSEHRPQDLDPLQRYINTKKAMAAIEYANAVAQAPSTIADADAQPRTAATLDDQFEEQSRQACAHLVEESLPAYITHRFVVLVTDTLVKEITGTSVPVLTDLVPDLAELFCLTDPALYDNPIIYASEGFHNTTQYGREYAIGRNCRFLQGPSTSHSTVRRLGEALDTRCEVTETILNYRRDGSPFINLVMIAPLYDNKGVVRYYLGCQMDVSPLMAAGQGLESLAQLLKEDDSGSRHRKSANHLIAELGSMLSDEEARVLRGKGSKTQHGAPRSRPSDRRPTGTDTRTLSRLLLGMDLVSLDRGLGPRGEDTGQSNGLPGVFRNYMLVRPFPSLRITFTSPSLRIPGLLQTRLMDRIGGPPQVRADISAALEEGTSFTARITWHTSSMTRTNSTPGPPPAREDLTRSKTPGPGPMGSGKPRWIHCTPLMGSDGRVGVWMIVMVEHEEVTGRLNRAWREQPSAAYAWNTLDGPAEEAERRAPGEHGLYAEYLRTDGHESRMTARSAQDTDVDEHFRDF